MPELIARDDAYDFPYNGALFIQPPLFGGSGVRVNDTYYDGSGEHPLPPGILVYLWEDAASGILELDGAGTFNYYPNPGTTYDEFKYILYNPSGTPLSSSLATVRLTAYGVPPPPPPPPTGSLDLFVRGHDVKTGGMSLYLRGIDAPAPKTTTLFTRGVDAPAPGTVSLFVEGVATPASSALPLFAAGLDAPAPGTATLFVEGGANGATGALPLYTRSVGSGQAGLTLYTQSASGADRGPLPLYLYAGDIPVATNNVSLFTHGADASGMMGGFTLFVEAASGDNALARSMPLFLAGATNGSAVRNMNLWVAGEAHAAHGSLDLFLLNAQSGVAGSFSMYVSGDGEAAGWNPSAKSLNLVLARDPANALPLYVRGPGTELGSGLALVITGSEASAHALPLAMPEVVGHDAKSVRLFIRGY